MQGQIKKLKWCIRALLNKPLWGKMGRLCYIGKPCFIADKKALFFGDKVRVYPGIRTETQDNGTVIIGNNVSIGQNFHAVSVGDKLKIGDDVTISGNVFISNCDHTFNDEYKPALEQPLTLKETSIGSASFIGYGAVILAGTHLGRHCVVGANSVVRGNFPDNTLLAGSPARVVKKFDTQEKKWIKV